MEQAVPLRELNGAEAERMLEDLARPPRQLPARMKQPLPMSQLAKLKVKLRSRAVQMQSYAAFLFYLSPEELYSSEHQISVIFRSQSLNGPFSDGWSSAMPSIRW